MIPSSLPPPSPLPPLLTPLPKMCNSGGGVRGLKHGEMDLAVAYKENNVYNMKPRGNESDAMLLSQSSGGSRLGPNP